MNIAAAKCPGVGTDAANVRRAWVGEVLSMAGDCRVCGRQVRISREWTVLSHHSVLACVA